MKPKPKDSEFNNLFRLINNNVYVHKTEYIYNKVYNQSLTEPSLKPAIVTSLKWLTSYSNKV